MAAVAATNADRPAAAKRAGGCDSGSGWASFDGQLEAGYSITISLKRR